MIKLSRPALPLILIIAFFLGCRSQAHREVAQQPATQFAVASPATFSGVLPCADCSGIRYTLNLEPGNVFYLRQTYLDKGEGESFYDIGSWSLSEYGKTLTLQGGREAPLMFAVKSAEVLSKLDLEGKEIPSQLNYNLTRAGQFEWFDVPLFMRGMYSYMADAGLFTECSTGKKFPVAQEGDNAALEAPYSKTRQQPGEALLINFEGRIARRPKMEGEGEQEMIVVERFNKVWPGETCEAKPAANTLEQTYWKLVELDSKPAATETGAREAHLQLSPGEKRVTGSSGCNRVMSTYEISGERLRFSKTATTRIACSEELMEQEKAFLNALEATATWKITGNNLELLSAAGTILARFEKKHL